MVMLDIYKKDKLKSLSYLAEQEVTNIRSKYTDFEIESFQDQRIEYRMWKQDNSSSTPIVDRLANGFGLTKEEMMQVIENKIMEIIDIQIKLSFKREQVLEAQTKDEVDAIVW